jgi:prepilin-type N-terminal cleavage/methylation domain-containing protein
MSDLRVDEEAFMFSLTKSATCRSTTRAFTLIEILVVVAIIALLIAILIPSLQRAREQSRRSVCLSNMHQMGIGFSGYSSESKGFLPWVGKFRYCLALAEFYVGQSGDDWVKCNAGALYPKFVGNNPDVFFCPSALARDESDFYSDPNHGVKAFVQRVHHPRKGDPAWADSHNSGNHPFYNYVYAAPVPEGKHPRDAGPNMYPTEVIQTRTGAEAAFDPTNPATGSPYWQYLNSDEESNFLYSLAKRSRGEHNIHALLSDAYFGGSNGIHIDSYNVLYGDFHAKRVVDPNAKINKTSISSGREGDPFEMTGSFGLQYQVWDYFSKSH